MLLLYFSGQILLHSFYFFSITFYSSREILEFLKAIFRFWNLQGSRDFFWSWKNIEIWSLHCLDLYKNFTTVLGPIIHWNRTLSSGSPPSLLIWFCWWNSFSFNCLCLSNKLQVEKLYYKSFNYLFKQIYIFPQYQELPWQLKFYLPLFDKIALEKVLTVLNYNTC